MHIHSYLTVRSYSNAHARIAMTALLELATVSCKLDEVRLACKTRVKLIGAD